MDEFGLSDIYRLKHPNEKRYSHIQKSPKVLTRIDFFLISNSIVRLVTKCGISPSIKSDHCLCFIDVELGIGAVKRGRGYWKLNCALLKDPIYCSRMRQTIINYETDHKEDDTNLHVRWDALKCVIRGKA